MDRPLLIQRRQKLMTTLAFVLSFSTLATCISVDATQDISHSKYKLEKTDRIVNSSHSNVTKDTSLYRNPTRWLNGTSSENIEPISTIHNLSLEINSNWNSSLSSGLTLLKVLSSVNQDCWNKSDVIKCIGAKMIQLVRSILHSSDSYEDLHDIRSNEVQNDKLSDIAEGNITLLHEIIMKQLRNHVAAVDLVEFGNEVEDSARAALSWFAPEGSGKSSFLTGFGLGFLAFGLKKLLLPLFIGAQIVKSVLIAMFLPSILGGLGKLVGKGVSTFASASGSSGPSNNNVDDFEFKDNMAFDAGDSATAASKYSSAFVYPEISSGSGFENGLTAGTLPAAALYVPGSAGIGSFNRFQQQATGNSKVSYASLPTGAQHHYGSYYTRHQQPNKKQDYKVFHNIPSSSLLLTNYDPFYSPLLSRLDSVFKQLGYETETCRERLVCAMYKSPAKFAPYSNLVSAQLSRELNELRKPSTDNPEILRFFRYMKAAKDGQDGADCIQMHPGCSSSSAHSTVHPPMIKTYHDINKLVHARGFGKSIGFLGSSGSSTERYLSQT